MKLNKKMMLAAAMAGILAVGLTACGDGTAPQNTQDNTTENVVDVNVKKGENTESPSSDAQIVDVGNFTFELPQGWKAFPQPDIFLEKDENGEYPLDKNYIYISRDAENEFEVYSKPAVSIRRYDLSTPLSSFKDMYENVEDLNVTVQGVACDEAFIGDYILSEGWTYQILTFKVNGGQFTVTIPTMAIGDPTFLTYDMPELQTVLETLASVAPEENDVAENVTEETTNSALSELFENRPDSFSSEEELDAYIDSVKNFTLGEQSTTYSISETENIENYIQEHVANTYTYTDIDSIIINEDLGTDENDYIVLLNLTWHQKNHADTTEQVLQMYSDDLAASIAEDLSNVQEVAIIWTVPYLNNSTSKWSYERKTNGMYLTDKMLGF